MRQITDPQARKQEVGNLIYQSILQAYGETNCGKITGMLLDENVVNFELLLTDQKYLNEYVGQAKSMLEIAPQAQPQSQTQNWVGSNIWGQTRYIYNNNDPVTIKD